MTTEIKDLDAESKSPKRPWVADSSKEQCTKCGASFTTFNRRHHCRQCGDLYCGTCTTKKIALPEFNYNKPVRVCDCCHAINTLKNALANKEEDTETIVVQGIAELSADKSNHAKMLHQGLLVHLFTLVSTASSYLLKLKTPTSPSTASNLNRQRSLRLQSGSWSRSILSQINQQLEDIQQSDKIEKDEAILLYASTAMLHFALNGKIKSELIESSSFLEAIICFLSMYTSSPSYSASPVSIQVQMNGCCIVLALMTSDDSVKSKIVQHVLPLFVELLAHHSHSNQNVTLKAAEALRELSTDKHFSESGGLTSMITLALSEDTELQSLAADAFFNMSIFSENVNKMIYNGALLPLLSLVSFSNSESVQLQALRTILNLCNTVENQRKLIKEGLLYCVRGVLDCRYKFTVNMVEIYKLAAVLVDRLSRNDETRELIGYPVVEDLLELLQACLEADAKLSVLKALITLAGQEKTRKDIVEKCPDIVGFLNGFASHKDKEVQVTAQNLVSLLVKTL